MRKRFSAVQWAAWFKEFEGSGRSVAEFCRRIGVSQNSFYIWRRKLKHSSIRQDELFVPVVIESATQVAIEFPCGAVLKVDNQVDSLRPIFEALAQTGEQQA